jgi:outer membrane protein
VKFFNLSTMKTPASMLSKITLSLLVAGSLAACKQNKTEEKAAAPAAANTTTAASAAPKTGEGEIVFVNSDSLLNKYTYFKDMADRLEKKGKAAQADLVSKGQAFQREVAEYQKAAATMPADQRQATACSVNSRNCRPTSKMPAPRYKTSKPASRPNYTKR